MSDTQDNQEGLPLVQAPELRSAVAPKKEDARISLSPQELTLVLDALNKAAKLGVFELSEFPIIGHIHQKFTAVINDLTKNV